MADKDFGVKRINLIGASGTPTILSPNNLNINASTVSISTDVSIGGQVVSNLRINNNYSVGIGTTIPSEKLHVIGNSILNGFVGIGTTANTNSRLIVNGDLRILSGIITGAPGNNVNSLNVNTINIPSDNYINVSSSVDGLRIGFINSSKIGIIQHLNLFGYLSLSGRDVRITSEDGTTSRFTVNSTGSNISGTLNVGTSGTVITTTSNGLVGIGSTLPANKLDVLGGDIRVGVNTSQGIILTAPNGTIYRLIVQNTGILTTTVVS